MPSLPSVARAPKLLQGRLSVATQPQASAARTITLSPQPAFNVLGNNGAVQTNYTGPVTVFASGGPNLAGTVTVNAVAGVATYTDLQFLDPGTATMTAQAAGRTSVTTVSITVT